MAVFFLRLSWIKQREFAIQLTHDSSAAARADREATATDNASLIASLPPSLRNQRFRNSAAGKVVLEIDTA